MKDPKKYTTAAKLVADLLGDPGIEQEVKRNLARRKRINALVSERAKANLTMREVAKRMGIPYRALHDIEETWEDKDLEDYPRVARAYVKAIRQNSKPKRREGWQSTGEPGFWYNGPCIRMAGRKPMEIQKKTQKGNKIMNNKELLERVHTFLSMLCRDGKCGDHCSACLEASDLADDVWAALHATEGSATQS